jgi:hypothetical protein
MPARKISARYAAEFKVNAITPLVNAGRLMPKAGSTK